MKYRQAITWLDSFSQQNIKLGLERIAYLLDKLGNPEKDLQVIHVAGTNGKGSVCRFISSILTQEDYVTGVYTSPHLLTMNERFCIDNTPISNHQLSGYISHIKTIIESYEHTDKYPTYFEICTALAFLYFKDKQVDYAVIEVGLGGRYDATNVITPLVSVITNVSYDHEQILGETIEKITKEKAGIIKTKTPVITAAEKPAFEIIQSTANRLNAPVIRVDVQRSKILEKSLFHQLISIQGNLDTYTLETTEIGSYQKENLSLAIHTIEQLQMLGVFLSRQSIEKGVQKMTHPGRMKVIMNQPYVIIDGAHNPNGMKELHTSIVSLFPTKKIILVLSVLKDKNVEKMIHEIKDIIQIVVLTQSTNSRALDLSQLYKKVSGIISPNMIKVSESVANGIESSLHSAQKDDLIVITGSLYTVQEAIEYCNKNRIENPNG